MTEQSTAPKREVEKDQNLWELYESRKAELQKQELSAGEYQKQCRRIADELGL